MCKNNIVIINTGAMRPNSTRAKTAIIFIWIVVGLEMVQLVSSYFQYSLLRDAANGSYISHSAAEANDMRERLLGIAGLIIYIISGITFIQWFRRAYFNLHTKVSNLEFTEGWAAGAWFVPITNLYRPYRIMQELFKETLILLKGNSEKAETDPDSSIIGWWWALWIINGIAGQVSMQVSLRTQTVDGLTISTVASMVGSVLMVPLAILTVKIINDYSRLEEQMVALPDDSLDDTEPKAVLPEKTAEEIL